jgi:phosphatidylglycerophosphate synthase
MGTGKTGSTASKVVNMSRRSRTNPLERSQTAPARELTALTQLAWVLGVGLAPMLITAVALVGFQSTPLGVALVAYAVAGALSIRLIRRGYPHSSLGLCNVVTIARMALVVALVAPLFGSSFPWAVVAVATVAQILDGVDGWWARRESLVSEFGARLDMEVDSGLGLILALNIWVVGIAGPWILVLGLPRYLFIGAAQVLPWLGRPLPESCSRKVVCVVQMIALTALNSPLVPDWLVVPFAAGIGGALLWSFGRDILWLWRIRP